MNSIQYRKMQPQQFLRPICRLLELDVVLIFYLESVLDVYERL